MAARPDNLPWLRVCNTLFCLALSLLSLGVGPAAAKVVTRTIDDTNGDSESGIVPVYTADQFSLNSDCDGCVYHPDPSQAFDQTWHDSSQVSATPSTVTFSFTGTSVALFCTLVNTQNMTTPVGITSLALSIDGNSYPPFSHVPDGSSDFAYQQRVFDVSGLQSAEHQVVLSTNAQDSILLFDYASYEFDDESSPQGPAVVQTTDTQTTTDTHTTTIVSTSTAAGHTSHSASTSAKSSSASASNSTSSAAGSTSSSPVNAGGAAVSSPASSSSASAVSALSSKSHVNVAVIAGVLGGVIAILLGILLLVLLCRRRSRSRQKADDAAAAAASAAEHQLSLALAMAAAATDSRAQQDYHAQVTVGDVDALVPELHYGRAGIGDPEKAVLRHTLFEHANSSRPQLKHQNSTATFASGSSLAVGNVVNTTASREMLLADGSDDEGHTGLNLSPRRAPGLSRTPSFKSGYSLNLPMTPPPGYEHTPPPMPTPRFPAEVERHSHYPPDDSVRLSDFLP